MKRISKIVLAFSMMLAVLISSENFAFAEDGIITGSLNDSVTYSIDTASGEMTIHGYGEAKFEDAEDDDYGNSELPWRKNVVKSLVFGRGISGISSSLIYSLDELESVYLGNSFFDTAPLRSLNHLKEIDVSSDNDYYTAEDGILYNKDMSVLYLVPRALKLDTFYVPSGVKVIEKYAFGTYGTDDGYSEGAEIKNIIFPKSVKRIGLNYVKNAERIFIFNKKCKLENWIGDDNNFCLSWCATTYMVGAKYYDPDNDNDETVNKFAPLIYKNSRYYAIGKEEYEYTGKTIKPDFAAFNKNCRLLREKKDYKITYSKGRKKVGKYSFTVKFKKGKDKKKKFYFSIIPTTVDFSKVSLKGRTLKLKWRKHAKETTGFEIKYSPDGKKWKTVRIKNKKATSKTVRFNKSPKYWQVNIRAYKVVKGKKYYSYWNI